MTHFPKLILFCPLLVFGCSFLTPGLDARTAAEQRSDTVWEGENFRTTESTTHNQRMLMAENADYNGDIVAEWYEDGTPKSLNGATHIFSKNSEPRDIMSLMVQRDIANAQVFARLMDTIDRYQSTVDKLLPLALPPPSTQPARRLSPEETALLERLLKGG